MDSLGVFFFIDFYGFVVDNHALRSGIWSGFIFYGTIQIVAGPVIFNG